MVHVHAKLYQAKCSGSSVINSELDVGLWLRISLEWIKQSTSGKRRYQLRFFQVWRKQFGKLWSTNEKMTLTFGIWPWKSIGFVRSSRYMLMQNIIKLGAAVYELSTYHAHTLFCPISQ